MPLPELQTADCGWIDIAYREAGDGPPLMLLHGLGGSSAVWEPQFEAFADRYRVIAWDMPGYGGTGEPRKDAPHITYYSQGLRDFFDVLTIKNAHVVGQSVAALIAANMCVLHREHVASLIFAHPLAGLGGLAEDERTRIKDERIAAFEAAGPAGFAEKAIGRVLGPKASDATKAKALEILSAAPVRGYKQATEMMAMTDIFEDLPRIDKPALVVAGDADPVAPVADCQKLAGAISGARLEVLPDLGHYGGLEDPAAFNDCLAGFLNEIEGK